MDPLPEDMSSINVCDLQNEEIDRRQNTNSNLFPPFYCEHHPESERESLSEVEFHKNKRYEMIPIWIASIWTVFDWIWTDSLKWL